ncbi:hypothetical protein [Sedimenticola hydrogenitrophicus]|uniref:hypothetical protein n=1 Tax=Sedimenticola hydrogenitrophicus TaxID=2967975 RepID=UPI0021A58966|nr:hypothetical protein [Sedimenticola hydrogenitrophicus]
MQYIHALPCTPLKSGLRFLRNRYLLSIPLLLLAAYVLSVGQLMLLALAFGLALGFVERINNLEHVAARFSPGTHTLKTFDGGAFPTEQRPARPRAGGKVVHDGGSFERARLGSVKK